MRVPSLLCIAAVIAGTSVVQAESWKMHTIDRSSRGADGVRLADVDRDGKLDIVTGWEEGGRIRVCFQPSSDQVTKPWPSVEVGKVKSPEDAMCVDVNNDGWLDVVSCCEGKEKAIFFHLNPGGTAGPANTRDVSPVRERGQWKTELLEPSKDVTCWMYCCSLDPSTLVFGSKEPAGQIALYDLKSRTFRKLRNAGWVMSLKPIDIDEDGDLDIVYSDRKGELRGVGWLEQLSDGNWADHVIGGQGLEVMFLDIARIDNQWLMACNTRNQHVQVLSAGEDITKPWNVRRVQHPANSGGGKGVAIGDLDGDGQFDLTCTCESAKDRFGAYWLKCPSPNQASIDAHEVWTFHDISGTELGEKYDQIELLDIDGDGDLDLLTCEERENLGVIWYENPFARRLFR